MSRRSVDLLIEDLREAVEKVERYTEALITTVSLVTKRPSTLIRGDL